VSTDRKLKKIVQAIIPERQNLPAIFLMVVSAALLTVIQAPLGWSFLAWGALVPFVLACTPQMRFRSLVLTAFVVGYVYWLVNVYWIVPITVIGWLAMCFYLSWFWVLPAVAVRFCRAKGFPLFIALPLVLVGAERLQGFPMGGFYWRFLGHSQYQHLALIQIADIFGAAGVSFVVAMVNGLLVDLLLLAASSWQSRRAVLTSAGSGGHSPPYRCRPSSDGPNADKSAGTVHACPFYTPRTPSWRITGPAVVATIVVVAGVVLYGQWRLRQAGQYVTEGPMVASLQSNVPQSVKRSHEKSEDIFDELMANSKAAVAHGAQLVVWPETMVQGLLDPALWPYLRNVDQDKAFHQALSEHARTGGVYVLVGAQGGEIMEDSAGHLRLGDYNSAYFYRPNGTRDPGRYDKIHLVLFGEYIPFRYTFPWLFERLKMFLPAGWNPDYSLEHGTRYTVFEMSAKEVSSSQHPVSGDASAPQTSNFNPQTSWRFGVIICYEDTIPYVARNFTLDKQGRKRIDWLVNISNDGWFVRFTAGSQRVVPSTELPQHMAICAFRAVENRLAVVRSVNTGISCLIESTGRIRNGYLAASDGFPQPAVKRTAMAGWFLDRLPIDKRVSFYSRHGEWFADGCAAVFVAALLWPLGLRLVRRRRQ
jgi:apolipoprotein N-acyltransferase